MWTNFLKMWKNSFVLILWLIKGTGNGGGGEEEGRIVFPEASFQRTCRSTSHSLCETTNKICTTHCSLLVSNIPNYQLARQISVLQSSKFPFSWYKPVSLSWYYGGCGNWWHKTTRPKTQICASIMPNTVGPSVTYWWIGASRTPQVLTDCINFSTRFCRPHHLNSHRTNLYAHITGFTVFYKRWADSNNYKGDVCQEILKQQHSRKTTAKCVTQKYDFQTQRFQWNQQHYGLPASLVCSRALDSFSATWTVWDPTLACNPENHTQGKTRSTLLVQIPQSEHWAEFDKSWHSHCSEHGRLLCLWLVPRVSRGAPWTNSEPAKSRPKYG